MQLGSQTLSPVVFQRHLVNRRYAKKKSKRVLLASLSLTSMVDMFSLLVIFLLQSFSASPELLVTKGIQLPSARTGRAIEDAPVLAIDSENVYLDQKRMGSVNEILAKPDALLDGLRGLRELWQKTHPNEEFKGELNLQAHRDVPGPVVAKLMGVLPTEAYGTVQLVVVSGGAHQGGAE